MYEYTFFFKQKTAYEIGVRLVGSEMCIRDSLVQSRGYALFFIFLVSFWQLAKQSFNHPFTLEQSMRLAGRCCCCCCCRCAATLLLLLYDPRCIAEHKPSQQTVSRFVFFGTHAEASNGTAAAAAAAVAVTAAAQQQ